MMIIVVVAHAATRGHAVAHSVAPTAVGHAVAQAIDVVVASTIIIIDDIIIIIVNTAPIASPVMVSMEGGWWRMTRVMVVVTTRVAAAGGRWWGYAAAHHITIVVNIIIITVVVVVDNIIMTRGRTSVDAAQATHAATVSIVVTASVHDAMTAVIADAVVDAVTGTDRVQGETIGSQAGRRTADRMRGRSWRAHQVVAHHRVTVDRMLVLHEIVHLTQ